jgi:hypothetical protein
VPGWSDAKIRLPLISWMYADGVPLLQYVLAGEILGAGRQNGADCCQRPVKTSRSEGMNLEGALF